MDTVLKLLLVALVLRLAGGICRAAGRSPWTKGLGWLASALAAWLAASGAGAWFPVWPVVFFALVGHVLDVCAPSRRIAIATELAWLVVVGLFSVPPLAWTRLAVLLAVFGGVAVVVDSLAYRIPAALRRILIPGASCAALVLVLLGGRFLASPLVKARDGNAAAGTGLLYLGVTGQNLHLGERRVLSSGAVAWLAQAAVGGAHPGALVFHGADPAGARQRAAEVLRRALLDAGYTVLTVEHPGYGESPPPGAADPKSVWDPLATGQAALELLTSLPRVAGIYLVGHSMGTVDVIRLLGRQPNVDGAILFGAGMHDPPGQLSEYWYERFHKDRRLTYRLSRTEVIELQRLYYDDRALLGLLAADHPPIVFARFEKEWRNIASTREEVYGLLPGRKRAWDIANSSHYFSVFSQSGLLLGDTRVARALVRRFAELHDPDRDTARTDAAKALSSL